MVTTQITTRQIKGEPSALRARKTTADQQTIDIEGGTFALGRSFVGFTGVSHPDWAGTGVFYVYLDRNDDLILNDTTGFPDVSTRIATLTISAGIIIAVVDERSHVNGVIDGYQIKYLEGANVFVRGDDVQEALDSIDAYFTAVFDPEPARHIRKTGIMADDEPQNTIFSTDGYEYSLGEDRLLVYVNGVAQFTPLDYIENDVNTIKFCEPIDDRDTVDILILPGSLGAKGGTTTLQGAYDNSPPASKNIDLDNGAITLSQTETTNSVLRLLSGNDSPALLISSSGTGASISATSNSDTNPVLLLKQDNTSASTISDVLILERNTSGAPSTGFGSSILTKIENSAGSLFDASRIITEAKDLSSPNEDAYMSFELSDNGTIREVMSLTNEGKLILDTNTTHAPLNIPVFTSNPTNLEPGDVWLTDISSTIRLNANVGGTIYSVVLT